jgi:2-polyprenyl-3-methyl-5-hydroxy-6-metoxy-1,4-benzoquinol methylase
MGSKFSSRWDEAEIMDDLDFAGSEMDQALRELETINKYLGGNAVTLEGLRLLLKNAPKEQEIKIVDLGCGGGDMLKLIADWGRKQQLRLTLTGVDANPYIIEYAQKRTRNYEEISYLTANIFDPEFQKQSFDVITSTLFTHHFNQQELEQLFSNWVTRARLGIVINDLHRHWLAYYSIKVITSLFSNSFMVKNDGPISVLRAFRKVDLTTLLTKAGISNFKLGWRWAFRWMLVIPTS